MLALGGALLSACGGSGGSSDSGPPPTPTSDLNLRAKDLKFDKKALAVPAGAQVTLTFDNEDPGAQHNFALYQDKSAKKSIFKSDLTSGKNAKDLTFMAPAAGTYFFRCDAHPDMNGTFYVH